VKKPSPAPDHSGAGLDALERSPADTSYDLNSDVQDATAAATAELPATLAEAVKSFLFHCQFEKNLSPKTLSAYALDLRQFSASLAGGGQTLLTVIGKPQLREYIQRLFDTLAVKSIKRKVATLKAFFHYLEREDVIVASPFRRMQIRIREPKRLPRTLTLAQLERILTTAYREAAALDAAGQEPSPALMRDVAVMELLFATGARVSELCNLKRDSVDLVNGTVRIFGKGRRERVIHVGDEEVLHALRCYISAVHGPTLEPDGFFFQNRMGGRLSEQSVRTILRKRVAGAGLDVRVTPHVFRHSVATLLLEEGVDIRYIQQFLGHSSITTTQIYTHVHDSAQKRIIATQHPRRRFRSVPP
jgi:integrase/recombinase XerD